MITGSSSMPVQGGGTQVDWRVFPSLGTDLNIAGSDEKVCLLFFMLWPRSELLMRAQSTEIPTTACDGLDWGCTENPCIRVCIIHIKPESGCPSHMPNKTPRVTVLGTLPFRVSTALPLPPSLTISTGYIPAA